MAFVSKKSVSRTEPCVICGKTDWCWIGDYGEDGCLHFCGRVHQSSVFGLDGETYELKNNRAFPNGVSQGNYYVYESVSQKEYQKQKWIEEQKRINPHFKATYSSSHKSPNPDMIPVQHKETVTVEDIKPLANKDLDAMYRYLLDLLILEDSHAQYLMQEWNKGHNKTLAQTLLSRYPIKSLPMNDAARFNGQFSLKNPTRKAILEKMVACFDSLKGMPGAFTKEDVWRLVNLSGIVYPVYDTDGYIWRIRIMDEHPILLEYAKHEDGSYIMETAPDGTLKEKIGAEYSFDQYHGEWIRKDLFTGTQEIVYSNKKGIYKVSLTLQGYPKIDGKVDGKYKNFSSRREGKHETEDKVIYFNRYQNGCRSGSKISLYCKKGDDFRYVYITEGEKKAMVLNELLNCPVICLPGVKTYGKIFAKEYLKDFSVFEWLLQHGATYFVVVFDADKNEKKEVAAAEAGLVAMCKQHEVITYVLQWDGRYGKGVDDCLIAGKWFQCVEV